MHSLIHMHNNNKLKLAPPSSGYEQSIVKNSSWSHARILNLFLRKLGDHYDALLPIKNCSKIHIDDPVIPVTLNDSCVGEISVNQRTTSADFHIHDKHSNNPPIGDCCNINGSKPTSGNQNIPVNHIYGINNCSDK